MKPIGVMVVDDSAVVRQVLVELLSSVPGIEVIATAQDPIFAMKQMKKQWPDVIILDVEMPRMDGITFLKKIMSEHPTPVVMCSSVTTQGGKQAIQAMAAGAVEIITKPKLGVKAFLGESRKRLIDAVKAAAMARIKGVSGAGKAVVTPKLSVDAVVAPATVGTALTGQGQLVVIGASTGGTQALETVLTGLSPTAPGVVVVQHMPERFTKAFAERLNSVCQVEVKEAEQNDQVIRGRVLIAPGSAHLLIRNMNGEYRVEVKDGPLISRHRPSVDVLFRSAAQAAGASAVGIIMTGMGDDGATGLKEMHDAGALTIAQDEASCVVYGMPKEAKRRGAVDASLPLDALAKAIMRGVPRNHNHS
ncbi:MAG: chemotaxis response regulator protein-glutamate methylesterase [Candidatus Sedimenticola sp. (ex Thyasira tokunagai)]